jgi:hypothetical protein
MTPQTYRLKAPTLGVRLEHGEKELLTIPKLALVFVAGGLPVGKEEDTDRTVDVLWEGKIVVLLEADLRKRAEPLTL